MSQTRPWVRGALGVCLLLASLLLAGCGTAEGVPMQITGAFQPVPAGGIDFGRYNELPGRRVGSLPYPGLVSLFDEADPAKLGRHTYDGSGEEKSRGILYTRRGGFIDIAHVREYVDLCKYAAVRTELALQNDWTEFQIKGMEPTLYIIHLQYPPFWRTLAPAEKQRLARELSIQIGQRVSMLIMTWHELLSWFGYESFALISEWRSAFTWDDTGSHFLGALVAGRALHDNLPWDDAVTVELNRALQEMGAVAPRQTKQAIDKVEGSWWGGFDPLKRNFDTGLDGRPVEPWLVRGLPFCRDAVPYRYKIPRLDAVLGYDFRGLVKIDIDPIIREADKIREVLPNRPWRIDADWELPVLINHMKQWHAQHDGEQALRPYEPPALATSGEQPVHAPSPSGSRRELAGSHHPPAPGSPPSQ